ncbi:hypothetical protein [Enterococcus dongliensis]|uniref:hypothetical protein n=1 Tax=Enterococcus dongliensis TaxID=2559925 RepID=UPI00288E5FFD|nr:hypothetical protein [Enterococcus dongliensis]MDT2603275.1 hypothetical protein [Enterococcus dongliensis]MDT2644199.1 hypothetical protein [Enterococcus dongliensis]MDT2670975.1 hypothetical protein [Enterococcus dongliensis]MDT2710850.1 hypothetical protein [Enterococcus dongliensis]
MEEARIQFTDEEGLIISEADQQQALELFVAHELTILALKAEEISLETTFLMITKEQNK